MSEDADADADADAAKDEEKKKHKDASKEKLLVFSVMVDRRYSEHLPQKYKRRKNRTVNLPKWPCR